MKDKVSLLLDTTGAGLHKRGYRPQANAAPIKETLAAALCDLARLRSYHTLYDPMCGSGTILIEGAMMVHNIAPGVNRYFSAERWDVIDENVWTQERSRARELVNYDTDFIAYGSDIDEAALEIAQINAKRAGVERKIRFEKADIRNFEPKSEKGTVICNPPYGERMLEQRGAQQLMRSFGRHLKFADGWKKYIISSEPEFEHYFGKQAAKKRKLYNGRLQCNVYMYF